MAHLRKRDPQILLGVLCDAASFELGILKPQRAAGKFICVTHQSVWTHLRKANKSRKKGTTFFLQRVHAGVQWRSDRNVTPRECGPIGHFDVLRRDDEEPFLAIGAKGKLEKSAMLTALLLLQTAATRLQIRWRWSLETRM